MAVTTPEWLSRHGGQVRPAPVGRSWLVYFDDEPQYVLTPIPVHGKVGCQVTQSINGKQVANSEPVATDDAALAQGLDELGKVLGW